MTKENLKSVLRRSTMAYKAAEVLYENSLYLPHIVRQRLVGTALGWRQGASPSRARQSVLTWNVPIPAWDGPEDLIGWLRSRGVRVFEGGHTFYIAPQDALRSIIPSVVAFYPDQCGFKILKNCSDPLRGRYVYKRGRSLKFLMRLIGRPHDQLSPANYMFLVGIGPQIWDVTCWESQGKRCTVFVVDHVAGSRPTIEQCSSFLNRLKHLNTNSRLRVLIPHWEQDPDFAPPDCNSNLIYSDALGRAQYIDFQNFGLTGLRHSDGRVSRGLTIPSSISDSAVDARVVNREAAAKKSWALVNELFREHSVSVEGRLILDIGCNTAITIGASLTSGAVWTVGWCDPEDAEDIEECLFSWGMTRFSLTSTGRIGDYPFEHDIPLNLRSWLKGAVVFWRGHASGPTQFDSLLRMPWDVFVCDRGDAECSKNLVDLLHNLPTSQFEVITPPDPHGAGSPVTLIRRRHTVA